MKQICIATKNWTLGLTWQQSLASEYLVELLEVESFEQLLLSLRKYAVDLLLVEIDALHPQGLSHIATILQEFPNLPILVYVEAYKETEQMFAILYGAKGYITSKIPFKLLNKAIEIVLQGEIWVDRKFISRLLLQITQLTRTQLLSLKPNNEKAISQLTARELEIAQLVATGVSNRVVAGELEISERTVKAHLSAIYQKLEVHDRLQLALIFQKRN